MEKHIEIWADSFHEGIWCGDNLAKFFSKNGYEISYTNLNGFMPQYTYQKNNITIKAIVYGSYKSWNPIPKQISNLLEWGKPDFIIYDPDCDKIIYAVEETAATPTGNQATQRCERQYGSARAKIPYWYFISEFGKHIDGGIRRDSIWPTIAAIKLTILHKTPCIVLHYSDEDNIENYEFGNGLNLLFKTLYKMLENYVIGKYIYDELDECLTEQYQSMIDFVLSQWSRIIDYLPSQDVLMDKDTSKKLVDYALNRNERK